MVDDQLPMTAAGMTAKDLQALHAAVQLLEHTSLAARLTQVVGKPMRRRSCCAGKPTSSDAAQPATRT